MGSTRIDGRRVGSVLIHDAMLVLPDGTETIGDVRAVDGRITEVAPGGGLEPSPDHVRLPQHAAGRAARGTPEPEGLAGALESLRSGGAEAVIDAHGWHLMPGVVDPQVHFRDPGFPLKETIGSGSRAALAGGVTTFLEMPNTKPATITMEAWRDKIATAARDAVTHHGFFLGATPANADTLAAALPKDDAGPPPAGLPGIKIFMGASTGDLLVNEESDQRRIFESTGGVIAVHAEDEALMRENWLRVQHRTDMAAHVEHRTDEVALRATQQAVRLAEETRHRLHVLHLTSGKEADWLAGRTGDIVTTETLPQHLTFDQDDIEAQGTRLKMNPPIRFTEDRETLWRRLHDGTISCIATDHAPHTLAEKQHGWPKAPSGMPGVETSLAVMLTHARDGRCSVGDVANWMCDGPARAYGMQGKGRLEVGADADLALVEMEAERVVKDHHSWTTVKWNPFAGRALVGWTRWTLVDGVPAFHRSGGIPGGRMLVDSGEVGRPVGCLRE